MAEQEDRFPPTPRDQLSPEAQKDHDLLQQIFDSYFGDLFPIKRADGAFIGPYAALLCTPGLAKPFFDLAAAFGKIKGLSPEARETAILTTGATFGAAFELYSHEIVARAKTSLTDAQVDCLKKGIRPEGKDRLNEDCDVAYDVAHQLLAVQGPLKQQYFDKAVKVLGMETTAALIHYIGYYAYVSVVLNTANASVPN